MPTSKRKMNWKPWKQPKIIGKRYNDRLGFNVCPATAAVASVCVFPAVAMRVHVQHACFCLVLSKKFNIMSALSVHQLPTLLQIIDSRAGLFLVQKGVSCKRRQNEYLFQRTAICTNFWAICY